MSSRPCCKAHSQSTQSICSASTALHLKDRLMMKAYSMFLKTTFDYFHQIHVDVETELVWRKVTNLDFFGSPVFNVLWCSENKHIDYKPCLFFRVSNRLCPSALRIPQQWAVSPHDEASCLPHMRGFIPGRWDPVKQWLLPRLGGKSKVAVLSGPSHRFATSTEPELKNNSQLSAAAVVPLISQMNAASISYGVEIGYRSISKYSC